jgi:hypothetical protein
VGALACGLLAASSAQASEQPTLDLTLDPGIAMSEPVGSTRHANAAAGREPPAARRGGSLRLEPMIRPDYSPADAHLPLPNGAMGDLMDEIDVEGLILRLRTPLPF